MASLDEQRARRWWRTGRRVRSIARAAAFIDDVGFALLFPTKRVDAPTLWNAVSDKPMESWDDWDADAERIWGWKDELPLRGLAWYGHLSFNRKSFLSPSLLAELYPRAGIPDDFAEADLSEEARRIAEVLLINGPTSAAELREIAGLDAGKRAAGIYNTAYVELCRALVITHCGIEQGSGSWPSAVIELTARVFDLTSEEPVEQRHRRAARLFVDTMLEARPAELARAFAWTAGAARMQLEALAEQGDVVRTGRGFTRAA